MESTAFNFDNLSLKNKEKKNKNKNKKNKIVGVHYLKL